MDLKTLRKCSEVIEKKYVENYEHEYNKLTSKFTIEDIDSIDKELQSLHADKFLASAVLGIDIYKYSKYSGFRQVLIPVLFDSLYQDTIEHCSCGELFLFQNEVQYNVSENIVDIKENETLKSFYGNNIPTGDGCFQIFKTPIQALVFAIYFQLNINHFNAYNDSAELREYVGDLCVRYTLTYGDVYRYDNGIISNWYGRPIINNARILSKDKLNRFLVDLSVIDWFQRRMVGIEHIGKYNLNMLKQQIDPFNTVSYSKVPIKNDDSEGMRVKMVDGRTVGPSIIFWGEYPLERLNGSLKPAINCIVIVFT